MARLREGLASQRLVVVTGPGGIGKTRLVLEVLPQLVAEFSGGIFFVPLAGLSDTRFVGTALIQALGLEHATELEPLEQAARSLAKDRKLVVFDNFEQLLPAGADALRFLVERAPELVCLVTSRQRLGLAGEREIALAPLATPAGDAVPESLARLPSVQILVDRAQAVRPDFQITKANAPAVAELVRRLEGIPLALALAAGRTQVLSPEKILDRIGERWTLLATRDRDVPERHRSLRAAIEGSTALLAPELLRLFARLSVFRGSFPLEAVEAVCEEPLALDRLSELRECSLVVADGNDRFEMLETLREYAGTLLTSEELRAARDRHALHYLGFAERAGSELTGAEQAAWRDRIATEYDNLLAALEYANANPDERQVGLRIAGSIWRFWSIRGPRSDGRRLLAEALASSPGRTPVRVAALAGAGVLATGTADFPAARSLFEESLALARGLRDPPGVARALNNLGGVASTLGDVENARILYEESAALARELGNQRLLAGTTQNLARIAYFQGDYPRASALFQEGLAIEEAQGHTAAIVHTKNLLGIVAIELGEAATARAWIEGALAAARAEADEQGVAMSLSNLGWLAASTGDAAEARRLQSESLALLRKFDARTEMAEALLGLANAATDASDPDAASAALDEASAIAAEVGDTRMAALVGAARGRLAHRGGDFATARVELARALVQIRALGERGRIAELLENLAAAEVAIGDAACAVRLVTAADELRRRSHAPRPRGGARAVEATLATARERLGDDGFATATSAGPFARWEDAVDFAVGPRS
jgi:predicted ATPase